MNTLISSQILPLGPNPFQKSLQTPPIPPQNLNFPLKTPRIPISKAASTDQNSDGIPSDEVKTLAKFKSLHNSIRVLEVSRRSDHPFAGARLLLLDAPGNIHSISFLFKPFISTYFDVFATLPPILPPGPTALLGFGAGSAARLILHLFPESELHGWELDPSVLAVAREFFGLSKLQNQYKHNLFLYIGDGLKAETRDGFAGILVDLFSKGSVIPELQEEETWENLKKKLRRGGRVMVNCGGSCVEAEDGKREGKLVMEKTLEAMGRVFAHQVFVLNLGYENTEDSCVALTGPLPDLNEWKKRLPKSLRCYVDMWKPLHY